MGAIRKRPGHVVVELELEKLMGGEVVLVQDGKYVPTGTTFNHAIGTWLLGLVRDKAPQHLRTFKAMTVLFDREQGCLVGIFADDPADMPEIVSGIRKEQDGRHETPL